MSKTLVWSHSFETAPRRAVSSSSAANPYVSWVSYALIATNAVVLLSYFFGVNSSAAQGYEMRKTQTSINKLAEENKKLMLKVSERTSIAQLQNEISQSSFVPVKTTLYVQGGKQLSKK